ncbi:chemotaxis protein CheA [Telmatocola sphagniphila]|uniref:histidine kinase n=1 Tax=Telmatocola sphagniphila TaxID=1123043 RepID=A0A8E6B8Y5_9BACT|nr:chemotaxis protein CheA [Telmatocola sphagniphila]QVL33557.1 chemotaxis protein CheA [Telmatocola sphagniphila]
MTEVMREFILETFENLAQLDTNLIALEKSPGDRSTLASVFRTLHSIKGSAGFVGLPKLQAISHAAENLLSRLRSGELKFNRPIATTLLAVVDAIRQIISSIERDQTEGTGDYAHLIGELDRLRETGGTVSPGLETETAKIPSAAPTTIIASEPIFAEAVAHPAPPITEFSDNASTGPIVPLAPLVEEVPLAEANLEAENTPKNHATVADTTIRVDVGLLDKLMNLVGELVLARNQIVQHSSDNSDRGFVGTVQRLNLLTSELQAGVMKTRMQPISTLWSKFPRVVRDLAVACGKKVQLDMEGQGTELDKTILEAIRDPLTHLVRNSVDHGIEAPELRRSKGKSPEGRLVLHAFHESSKVVVEIRDDGGGIDPARVRDKAVRSKIITPEEAARLTDREAVNLIFMPGFSTTEQITQFSGRGVGMDVVRTNVEKIGGTVDVDSQVGLGTTVRMKIPLTLAIIPALSITCAGERYCIPQVNLLELVRIEGDQVARKIEKIHGTPVFRLRGNLLPIVFLQEQLKLSACRPEGSDLFIVVLQVEDRQLGLVVDAIHDTEEIVVKPLQKQHKSISVFAGATIMGDGRVALILDVMGIAVRSGVLSGRRGRSVGDANTKSASGVQTVPVLVFATFDDNRMAIPLPAVARLEEFSIANFEKAGSRQMIQYRGEILPLLDISQELRQFDSLGQRPSIQDVTYSEHFKNRESTPVVVCTEDGQNVGLIVDRIIDIVDEERTSQARSTRPGILFNAVVQGRVTEFPDISAIIRSLKA